MAIHRSKRQIKIYSIIHTAVICNLIFLNHSLKVFYVLTEIWREIQANTTPPVEDPFDHQNDIDGQAERCRQEGFVVELVDK